MRKRKIMEEYKPDKLWVDELHRAVLRYNQHELFSNWCRLRSECWDIEEEFLIRDIRKANTEKEDGR